MCVDSSGLAICSVLSQKDSRGRERVIAYASHGLSMTERQWSTYDRELWAVIWSVKHCRHYLLHSSFQILTDHKTLVGLRKVPIQIDPTGRRARWALEIDPLDWVVVYRNGSGQANADAMSRRVDEIDTQAQANKQNHRETPQIHRKKTQSQINLLLEMMIT